MLEELINREGLRIALSGRDDVSLEPITKFIMKNIINPNYTELLVDVTNVILGNNNYYYYLIILVNIYDRCIEFNNNFMFIELKNI